MIVSVVVPTYNRGSKLGETLDALLANETDGIDTVEIIVVDDGSQLEAVPFCESRQPRPPFTLRCIRQSNAGPAAARNLGCRKARGDLILFVDDDIIAPADLIQQHITVHKLHSGTIVCGQCVLVKAKNQLLARFMNSLQAETGPERSKPLVPGDIVSSGQLSLERRTVNRIGEPYAGDLRIPAGEEFEFSARLQELGIKILYARDIVALHDQDLGFRSICGQQFKHALGCAEAAIKYPGTLKLPQVRSVIACNGFIDSHDSMTTAFKKIGKAALAAPTVRSVLIKCAEFLEAHIPVYAINKIAYRLVIGLYFFAGVRQGLHEFGAERRAAGRTLHAIPGR